MGSCKHWWASELRACCVFLTLVQTHTSANWADNFIAELNDTHIEADLRMRHAPAPVSLMVV